MDKAYTTFTPYPIPPDLSGRGIHLGTSGYYYDDWVGLFNPPKMTKRRLEQAPDQDRLDQDRLRFYQKYFSFVEINSTFYSEPNLAHFIDIESRSKPSMLYAVKVHRSISHTRGSNRDAGVEAMARHITAVSPLIETGRFFSFLIQLDDHVFRTMDKLDYLLAVAAEAVSHRIDVHIEFRHISWHTRQVLQALKDAGVGICNTDIPPIPSAFPLKSYATTDKGYIRYSGRNLTNWHQTGPAVSARERIARRNARYDYDYSGEELSRHADAQKLLLTKASHVAVAYNNHFQAAAIRNAMENLRMLVERMKPGINHG